MTNEQRLKLLAPPTGRIDMVLDTDAYNEIDDQYAIAYALRSKEKVSLKALYAAPFSNKKAAAPEEGMEKSYQEILNLLRLAGEECHAFRGSPRYMRDEQTAVDSPAARDLCERAMQYTAENPLYVVAIGAITNIGSALVMKPEIAERIVIVWLGGNALEWPDNREFNCRQDVAAVRVVYDCGAPLVILPCMGVVSAFTTTGPELIYWLRGKSTLCDYLVRHTIDEANTYAAGKVWSRAIWDVTAVGWLFNANNKFMRSKLIPTPIPEYDLHYNIDKNRPLCCYITHINRDRLFGDLFEKLSI